MSTAEKLTPGYRLRALMARKDKCLPMMHTPTAAAARIMEQAGCEAAFVGTSAVVGTYIDDTPLGSSNGWARATVFALDLFRSRPLRDSKTRRRRAMIAGSDDNFGKRTVARSAFASGACSTVAMPCAPSSATVRLQ